MKKEIKPIWKNLKDLDAEIRTIEHQTFKEEKEPDVYFVEVGLFKSLGEQGDILTLDYEKKPTEEQIKQDVVFYLEDLKRKLEGSLITGREEQHLKVLNKILK